MPFSDSLSARDPVLTQTPMETERTADIASVITVKPLGNSSLFTFGNFLFSPQPPRSHSHWCRTDYPTSPVYHSEADVTSIEPTPSVQIWPGSAGVSPALPYLSGGSRSKDSLISGCGQERARRPRSQPQRTGQRRLNAANAATR